MVGFAGLLLVLLYYSDEQSYNANNTNAIEIYRVIHKMSDGDIWDSSTKVEGLKYKEEIPEIVDFYLSDSWTQSTFVKIGGRQLFFEGILVGNSNFFNFFPFEIIKGSAASFKKARNHLAISEKQAKIIFGDAPALGKTIDIFDINYTITTVYKIIG